jgi:inositol-phosphate phosphatase/L-galactose 1-phosphate phosphatase/histidinol-phosphatase
MSAALLTFAHRLADAAGAAIRPHFGQPLTVDIKADASPVSVADRAAEAAMRAIIEQHYPDHGIYGEEAGEKKTANAYTWVLDPIDGTRAFIAGGKEWGTLIALCENGVPILGILDQPVTSERWVGMRGQPSTYQGTAIATRPCAALSAASISSTSRHYFTPPQAAAFVKLAEQCAEVTENGDCYAYGMLARGLRDMVVDAGLKPYDILALVPIIEGAGGKITAWDGAAVTLSHYATALASCDPALHAGGQAMLQSS